MSGYQHQPGTWVSWGGISAYLLGPRKIGYWTWLPIKIPHKSCGKWEYGIRIRPSSQMCRILHPYGVDAYLHCRAITSQNLLGADGPHDHNTWCVIKAPLDFWSSLLGFHWIIHVCWFSLTSLSVDFVFDIIYIICIVCKKWYIYIYYMI